MSSDSIVNGSAPAFSRDFGKKKRTNRLAKLKQCKLDARREQWLSQVKNNKGGFKDESNVGGGGGSPLSSLHRIDEGGNRSSSKDLESTRSRGGEENEGSSLHDSDLEFLANSPNTDSRRKECFGSGSGSGSSSTSSNSSDCCSGSLTDEEEQEHEEEDDDGCLDDWEAVADALSAEDKGNFTDSKPPQEIVPSGGSVAPHEMPNRAGEGGALKPKCNNEGRQVGENGRAWRPDDAFRPQCLPTLAKQYSFPMNSERGCGGRGGIAWGCHNVISQPSSCPICYEDLDLTDSSFTPCLCGFRLCLFCHKRILEADGRCPGCRKQYDSVTGESGINGGTSRYRFARSYSMSMGS